MTDETIPILSRAVFLLLLSSTSFGELPDGWTLCGAGVVVGSGLYSFHQERKATIGEKSRIAVISFDK
jgi:hypothetical protein